VLHYRRFGTTYRSHIQGSRKPRTVALTLKMRLGPIGCPETLVSDYQSTLRKMAKQRWSHEISVRRNRKLNRSVGYIRLRSETCGKHKMEKFACVCLILRVCASFTTWTLDSDVLPGSKPIVSSKLLKVLRWRLAFGRLQGVLLDFHHIFFMFTFMSWRWKQYILPKGWYNLLNNRMFWAGKPQENVWHDEKFKSQI
jgi:hypothetical protein